MIALGAVAGELTQGGQAGIDFLNGFPGWISYGVQWGIKGLILSAGVIGGAAMLGLVVKVFTK